MLITYKIQIMKRNDVWYTLPDTEFSSKEKAIAYAEKYYANRYRIIEIQ